jgi:hypothetical protein
LIVVLLLINAIHAVHTELIFQDTVPTPRHSDWSIVEFSHRQLAGLIRLRQKIAATRLRGRDCAPFHNLADADRILLVPTLCALGVLCRNARESWVV